MLDPASWAVVGLALSVILVLPHIPLLLESPRAAALAACSVIMSGTAMLAGVAAALLFGLAALVGQISRR
jgi:hypothetical protein